MKPPVLCRHCGRELPRHAPEGLCPKCLLDACAAALGTSEDRDQGSEVGGQNAEPFPTDTTHHEAIVSQLANRFGNYELLEKIGEGGMGVVYKARQTNLDRLVAVKLLPFSQFSREDVVQRFRTEAAAAASLQHPNIVAIHEIGEHEGQQYFSMDLVVGRTLAEVVREQPLSAKRAAAYLKSIAEAIHYAHQQGILHRDLKPSNVLIDESDQPRITDFGLAKRLGNGSELGARSSDLTFTGQVLGSPNFMAPEQAEGRPQSVGPASDIYSLGALLYHLLTRQPPFQADSITTLLKQVVESEPVSPRLLNPSIPRDLETICLKCLQKEPLRRYVTAHELAQDLGRFLEERPIQARAVGPAGKAWKWCRRRPALASMAGGLALMFILGLSGVLWQWRRAREMADAEFQQRQRAEASAYASDMRFAQLALAENNRGLALSLLDKYSPVGHSKIRNSKSNQDLRGWEWRYLWKLSQGDDFTLDRVPSLAGQAVSKDGKLLAVANVEAITLWDLAARRPVSTLRPGAGGPLALSAAGNCLAIGHREGSGQPGVEIWELVHGKLHRMLQTVRCEARVRSLAISADGNLLATFDDRGGIGLVNWRSGQVLTNLRVAPPRLGGSGIVTFSPDGGRLAIGEGYGKARLLTLPTGPMLDLATPYGAILQGLVFAPSSDLLAGGYRQYAGSNRVVSLWDGHSGLLRAQVTNQADAGALAFSTDSQRLFCANSDGSMAIWSTIDYRELSSFRRTLHSSVDTTFALDLLPDDRTFVSADGRWVSIWEVTAANRPFCHTNFTVAFPLESLGELAPEQFVAGTIDPRAVRRSAFAFTPKGEAFLMSDAYGSLVRWDSQSVQPTGTLDTLGSNHWGLAFSPDGRWLAAGAAHGGLTVWDWPATRAVTNFSMPIEFIGTVRFSQRGQFLHAAAANNQGETKVRLWRTADWTEIPLNESQFAGLSAIAISPDERMLAGGFRDGAVKLFRFPLGKPEAAMEHDHLVSGVYFSRDGRQLISASLDRLVIVWDVAAREKLATLQGPGYVWGAALSPDRGRLATGGHGPANAVILWDLSARQPLLSLPGNGQFFFHIAFSPDENTLVAISMSGTAELWRAPSWEEIEAVESRR